MDISRLGDQNKHIEQHRFQSDLNPIENKSNTTSAGADAPDSVQFTPSRNDSIELSRSTFKKEIDFAHKIYSDLNTQSSDRVRQARANIKSGAYDLNNPKVADKIIEGLAGDIAGKSAIGANIVSSAEETSESASNQNILEEVREKVKNNQDVLDTVARRLYKSISKI